MLELVAADISEQHQFYINVLNVVIQALVTTAPILLGLYLKHRADAAEYRKQLARSTAAAVSASVAADKADEVIKTLNNGIKDKLVDIQFKVSNPEKGA